MDTLKNIVNFTLILINAGGLTRMLYCLIRIAANPDTLESYSKKMKNLLIFLAIANCALELSVVIQKYF